MFKHEPVELGYGDLVAETSPNGRIYKDPKGKEYPSVTTVLKILSEEAIQAWRARVGEESPFRAEESELAVFFNSVGFKYQKVDIDKLRSVKGLEFQRKVNGIRQQINNEARKFRDGKISREELNTNIDEIKDKFYDIRNSYRNALNIKLNLKKPALISEIPKIISDAVSKKTSEIFSISDYNKYNQFDNLISQPD